MRSQAQRAAVTFCVLFTATMGIWSLAGLAFAGPEPGICYSLTILLACALLAALQSLWFSGAPIRRLAYPARVLGFGATALPALILCAWLGAWFPMDDAGPWVSFCVIYLVALAGASAGYALHYRRVAGGYDAALARYREERGEEASAPPR